MLIKSTLIAAAAAIALSGAAIADEAKGPRMLNDAQMDQIVAGSSHDKPYVHSTATGEVMFSFIPSSGSMNIYAGPELDGEVAVSLSSSVTGTVQGAMTSSGAFYTSCALCGTP